MASIKTDSSLRDYQIFVKQVYGSPNERHFSAEEMLTNVSRFAMRGLKGIRKNSPDKIKQNISIAISWSISLMNQLGIDIEEAVWKRFPYTCSYCGECPCACREKKVQKRVKIEVNESLRPKTVGGLQEMFSKIYPAEKRTLEHAGIHLAEEVGESAEAVLRFRGHHTEKDFEQVILESADLFSCFMGILNSAGIDYQKELVSMFSNGCHSCKHTPCKCGYDFVVNFKS